MTARLIDLCVSKRLALDKTGTLVRPESGREILRVPTLEPGVFRPVSPSLARRFRALGRWLDATHGHWLSAFDMEALWQPEIVDPWLAAVRRQHIFAMEEWPDIASAMFRPERLSLFAGSDTGSEQVFLLWLDFEEEPEVWVYDEDGESRYRNLDAYLEACLGERPVAAGRSWRAE